MRTRLFILVAGWALLAAGACLAQQQQPATPNPISQGAVTILTDGISDPAGDISRALSELSLRLDKVGKLRVLPIMGYGGAANARDLLHLRGADFAILNSDILTYLDLTKTLTGARSRIRYVAKLFDQKVYLIARPRIASLDQLEGRKLVTLGEASASAITARSLFGLLKIKADFVVLKDGKALEALPPEEMDAFLFLERDLASLPMSLKSGAMHLLPIPAGGPLAKVYREAMISPGELQDPVQSEAIPSVKVDTLLAVFDWKTPGGRQADVARFIQSFFEALPGLKRDLPDSLWQETDIHASIPDWQRYGPANALRAAISPESVKPAEANFSPAQPGNAEPVRFSIVSRPPLADRREPGGGLMAELASAFMGFMESDLGGAQPVISWSGDPSRQLDELFNQRSVDLALPWEKPDCDQPNDLGPNSAQVCDRALISEPIFQSVFALFVRADSDFTFANEDSIAGKTLCLPDRQDVSDLNGEGRRWVSAKKISLVRPATLIDCLSLIERREADGVLVEELEGRLAIDRLGLSSAFRMAERHIATRGLHVIVAKDHPKAEALINAVNKAIARLRQSDAYSAIIGKHISRLMAHSVAK